MEIKVVKQILQWNEDCSDELKDMFKEKKIYVINIMGSPGAGKTSLIMNIIKNLRDKYKITVIEADLASQIDAEKIDSIGIPVVQLNTEGACHIEAMSIKNIVSGLDLDSTDIIIIENIGNLVCPAEFNIGEDIKIAVLSVPEGDDKVVKYPVMFSNSDCLVINKYDMVKYFSFDCSKVYNDARSVNPDISIFPVSSSTGSGINEFTKWMEGQVSQKVK